VQINVLISTNSSIPTLKPVQIRFVFTEPLTASNKSLLIDRKAEQAHLKVAWKVGNFQPLLICGQQQIGKTSLVQASLDSTVKLASIQLQQLGARSNAVHILQLICDEILRQNIYPLQVIDRLREDPYPIFSGYMKDVCLDLGTTGLVIVLDGFEFVEQQANRLEIRGLLSFLWSLSQSESNLGIAFLTTSTLAELNATFDTSFTRYMQPITLGFLTEKGVATFLRNPTPDFLPYCHDLAVRRIMELTAGQPYLVQLSAWFLFDWYNNQIRAGNPQDPLLTNVDVKQALESTRFELQCERYYRGMVDEAKRIDPEYALPILKQIAREPKDPSSDELLGRNLERPLHTDKILDHLEAHLIIERIQTDANMPPRWRIKVPIFHEWLKKQV